MAELLSQSQIDELLGLAKKSSNDPEPQTTSISSTSQKVRTYDFTTPKKFNKDHLKLLNGVYESYSRTLSSHITSMLRLTCEVELISIEEQRYFEFNNALGENDIISLVNMDFTGSEQIESHFLFQISNQTVLAMIDRLLGGNGIPDEIENDSYTDIELSIYENISKRLSVIVKDAWNNYVDLDVNYHRYETNPKLVQTVSFDEIVIIIVLSVRLQDTEGILNVCLPSDLLMGIFDMFERDQSSANPYKKIVDPDLVDGILHNIKNSSLEMKSILGNANITIGDLYSMQVGDVINLSKPKDSNVYLLIEDEPWFEGKLGVYKQNKAIKINGVCERTNGIIGGKL